MSIFEKQNQPQVTNPLLQSANLQSQQPQSQQPQLPQQQQQQQQNALSDIEKQKEHINNIQSLYNQIRASPQFMNESVRENLDLNLKSFEYFAEKNSLLPTKRIDQLYAITSNFRKQLEKKQVSNSALDLYLSKENINLQRIEKEITELQNTIQTKYDIPHEQSASSTQDRFFSFDNYEQSIRLQSNLINSNLSSTALGDMKTTMLNIIKQKRQNLMSISGKLKDNSILTPKKKGVNSLITGSVYNAIGNTIYGNNNQNNLMKKSANSVAESNLFVGIPQKGNDDRLLFNDYFNCFKNYFDYKSNQHQQIEEDNANNRNQLLISLLSITNTFTGMRKQIFDLLNFQLRSNSNSNNNLNKLSANKVIANTVQYYENLFYSQLANKVQNPSDFSSMLKVIEDYAYQNIYSKFPNVIHSNRSDMSQWAKLFYFLRCGLENHCKTYINSISQNNPDLTLFNSILSSKTLSPDDYQNLLSSVDQNDSITNPYKHACFVLISKKNQPLNDNILSDMNDYLWMHLKLISQDNRFKLIKSDSSLNKFLTLKDFQNYILQLSPQDIISNSNEIPFEYTKWLISIMLYNKAIDFLAKQNGYLIDTAFMNMILIQINMQNDYKSEEIDNVYSDYNDEDDKLINEPQNKRQQHQEQQFKCSSIINNESIGNLPQTALLIKFTEANYCEIIGNMILYSSDYTIFNGYDERSQLEFNRLFTEEDYINILRHIAERYPSLTYYSQKQLTLLIKELKRHKLSHEIVNLMIYHQCQFIQKITPKKMINKLIHQSNEGSLTNEDIEDNSRLFDYWKNESLDRDFDSKYRNDYKFLRQLESIPSIYYDIENDNEMNAYNTFFKWIKMIPETQDVNLFINSDYLQLNAYLQNIYPEICYLGVYLIQFIQSTKSSSNYYGRNQDESMIYAQERLAQIEAFIENLVQLKINQQINDKLKCILNIIRDLTTQY